jgi:hypothetical protein
MNQVKVMQDYGNMSTALRRNKGDETHKLRYQAIAWQMTVYGFEGTAQTRFPSKSRTHTCQAILIQGKYGFDGRTSATDEYIC